MLFGGHRACMIFCCPMSHFVNGLADAVYGWLAGWLAGWLPACLPACLAAWLAGWLPGWLVNWLHATYLLLEPPSVLCLYSSQTWALHTWRRIVSLYIEHAYLHVYAIDDCTSTTRCCSTNLSNLCDISCTVECQNKTGRCELFCRWWSVLYRPIITGREIDFLF